MKKVTAMFLCIILAVCAFPVSAFAGVEYDITINGETFTSNNLEITCGTGTATYDHNSRTLTLDNAEITVSDKDGILVYNEDNIDNYDTLNIVLKGENTIEYTGTGNPTGLYSETSKLTISGKDENSSLKIEGFYKGISAPEIVLKSGTVTITDVSIGIENNYLKIDGGKINITEADTCGIETDNLDINAGTVDISCKEEIGIYVLEKMNVAGGTITAKGNTYGICVENSLTVEGGTITATGKRNDGISVAGRMTVSGGEIIADGKNSYGLRSRENMIVTGGKITATGVYSGIFADKDMAVEKGEISGTGDTCGIIISGNLNADGGEISGNGSDCGISVLGELTANGGKITGTGVIGGVSANRNIIANGGEIIGKSTGIDGLGILANRDITMNDGKIKATGETGINTKRMFVNGGDVSATGTRIGIEVISTDYGDVDENATLQELQATVFKMKDGSITAEGTSDNGKAFDFLPAVSGFEEYRWRTDKSADYSEEAIPENFVIGKYFEIRKKQTVYASSVVHQIAPVENSAASGAEISAASGEENPNTGADFAGILFAGAALVLAGAGAIRKGKKH